MKMKVFAIGIWLLLAGVAVCGCGKKNVGNDGAGSTGKGQTEYANEKESVSLKAGIGIGTEKRLEGHEEGSEEIELTDSDGQRIGDANSDGSVAEDATTEGTATEGTQGLQKAQGENAANGGNEVQGQPSGTDVVESPEVPIAEAPVSSGTENAEQQGQPAGGQQPEEQPQGNTVQPETPAPTVAEKPIDLCMLGAWDENKIYDILVEYSNGTITESEAEQRVMAVTQPAVIGSVRREGMSLGHPKPVYISKCKVWVEVHPDTDFISLQEPYFTDAAWGVFQWGVGLMKYIGQTEAGNQAVYRCSYVVLPQGM